jgi:hypothetical protein
MHDDDGKRRRRKLGPLRGERLTVSLLFARKKEGPKKRIYC